MPSCDRATTGMYVLYGWEQAQLGSQEDTITGLGFPLGKGGAGIGGCVLVWIWLQSLLAQV